MLQQFRTRFPVSDDKWNEYIACFNQIKVPARTVLLHEGEVPHKAFVVEKGCIRVWYNDDGKDITFQFFFEGQVVASIESFKKALPSPISIETIEPCTLWSIHKKDAERILEETSEIPELRHRLIDGVFERAFTYMKHSFSFVKDTPKQRYLTLMNEKPQLIQRVPQHYIASYLGISTVHLSRIKGAMAREKPEPRI